MTTDGSIGWAFAESTGFFGCQLAIEATGSTRNYQDSEMGTGVLMPCTGTLRISSPVDVSLDMVC